MIFGLNAEQYRYISEQLVAPLEQAGVRVFCYGSRARGDHRPFSDLDLMVESETDLAEQISQLQEMLTDSDFPYKVDLVEFRHFAESYKAGYQRDKQRWKRAETGPRQPEGKKVS